MAKIYSVDWRNYLKEIEDINTELERYSQALTPVEQYKLGTRKNEALQAHSKTIFQNIGNEVNKKLEKLDSERRIFSAYKKREIDSWDSAKLSSEYGVTSVILDMATVGVNKMTGDTEVTRVERLWKEALDSQNKYKMRAISELIEGVIAKVHPDEGMKLNNIKDEANKKLAEIRNTPEKQKSRDNVFTAFEEFSQALREYRSVSAMIGMDSQAFVNLRKLQISDDEDGLPKAEFFDDTPK